MIYLNIDGGSIKGEAADQNFTGQIEVRSFNHSFLQPKSATSSSAGGATMARAEFEDVFFTKHLDLASPNLYTALAGGKTFGEMVLTFLRADASSATSSAPISYLVISMKNVLISSVTVSQPNESELPLETIGLRATAIQWKYTQQAVKGGQTGSSQTAWNMAKNTNTYS